jgi:glycosyltransferase involved in cell wall biosynthesis
VKITLIIATYNRAAQLIAALKSVVKQDLPSDRWECIVVNNNSKDDTKERFEAFAAQYPALNLRLVSEQKQGLSHARNRGIAEAKSPIIAIIDDDERINSGFLRAYLDFFDTHLLVSLAGGRIIAEYPSGRPSWLSKYTEVPIANPIDLGDKIRPFPAGRIPGGGNMAFRCSVVEQHGAFDPALGRVGRELIGGEESDFFERAMCGGKQCWYVPDAVMWHIIPPEKLTEEYFKRLCYHIGVSQRVRAKLNRRYPKIILLEILKWGATLLLSCTMHPRKSLWLLRMRHQISKGVFKVES